MISFYQYHQTKDQFRELVTYYAIQGFFRSEIPSSNWPAFKRLSWHQKILRTKPKRTVRLLQEVELFSLKCQQEPKVHWPDDDDARARASVVLRGDTNISSGPKKKTSLRLKLPAVGEAVYELVVGGPE